MKEVNLLKSLPASKKNVEKRSEGKSEDVIAASKKYGELYFDGPREYGYGGYKYDGRWIPVAKDIIKHFNLKKGSKVLDVGCAKGFLVKDLLNLGIDAYGIDISQYALNNCEAETIGRLHLGSAEKLPFPDNSFDAVIAINSIHNLEKQKCLSALKEIQRVSPHNSFVQVDSYRNEKEKEIFLSWVLTAEFHGYPDEWISLFKEAGYKGDYYWTIV
jgi:SAM-dependent methyltransferase